MYTVDTLYGITCDISEELIRHYKSELEPDVTLKMQLEMFAVLDADYLGTLLYRRMGVVRFPTVRMLEAHGSAAHPDGFLYADLIDSKIVYANILEWIDRYDGKYDVLYVTCCNMGYVLLPQRQSTLVYPMGSHSGAALVMEARGESISNLVVAQGRKK